MAEKRQEKSLIRNNRRLQGDYCQVDLESPGIAPLVAPGQFVHVKMPNLEHRILRRPFSVYDTDPKDGRLSIVYKVIGLGTAHLATLKPGTELDLLGPLGVGFTPPRPEQTPIVVAGGYGCAATYLLARQSPVPAYCLLGGRSADDLLLVEEFKQLDAQVELATDDGSRGRRGLVTELLEELLARGDLRNPQIYACGPVGMLKAVGRIAHQSGLVAEISLDHAMCCGVGACFACVVKVKADTPAGWDYARTCVEGPVFRSDQAVWE